MRMKITLITFYMMVVFCGLLQAKAYEITKQQIGGSGSGVLEKDGIKLYSTFGQTSPAGAYDEKDGVKLYSGYLVIGGRPIGSIKKTPFNNQLGVEISTAVYVSFDMELDEDSIDSAVSIEAVCNNKNAAMHQDIPVTITYNPADNAITIVPSQPLDNNYQYRVLISTALKEAIDGFNLPEAESLRFTTIINPHKDNVSVCENNEDLQVEVYEGTFDEYFYVRISTTPIEPPAEDIEEASTKAVTNDATKEILGLYEFVPFNENDDKINGNPSNKMNVSMPFNLSGMRRSPALTQSESAQLRLKRNVNLYRLNEEKKLWVRIPGISVDHTNNILHASIPKFGTFALIIDPDHYLGDSYAYPVPFSPNKNSNHTNITFTNIATRCTIKIYTINGELVRELHESDGDGELIWDVESHIASGVYLYTIESLQDKKIGKLMIIK